MKPFKNRLSERFFSPKEQTLFSPRELACIDHLSLGHTARETAESLGLSPRTVEAYLENIKNKLGCNRKSEILSMILNLSLCGDPSVASNQDVA